MKIEIAYIREATEGTSLSFLTPLLKRTLEECDKFIEELNKYSGQKFWVASPKGVGEGGVVELYAYLEGVGVGFIALKPLSCGGVELSLLFEEDSPREELKKVFLGDGSPLYDLAVSLVWNLFDFKLKVWNLMTSLVLWGELGKPIILTKDEFNSLRDMALESYANVIFFSRYWRGAFSKREKETGEVVNSIKEILSEYLGTHGDENE